MPIAPPHPRQLLARCAARALAAAAALAVAAGSDAAEVIDIRAGYWEVVWTIPGTPTSREFQCITAEEIEGMRFFRTMQKGCDVTGGTQTRTRYEFTAVCVEDGPRATVRGLLVAADPLRFDLRAQSELRGQTVEAKGAYRWLQESCTRVGVPIS